jgi:hypothetical protein
MSKALKQALSEQLHRCHPLGYNHKVVKRWLRQIADADWQRLLDKIRTGAKGGEAEWLVEEVLWTRLCAEDLAQDREPKKEQKKRIKALKRIAIKIDEVVQILRKQVAEKEERENWERENMPPPPEDDDSPESEPLPEGKDPIAEAKRSLDWLERQAKAFHTQAEYVPRGDGKRYDKRHSQVRVYNTFAAMISHSLREVAGQPLYAHASDITNIVFPAAYMTEDRVVAACKPTTREGRRGKAGALKRAKSAE